MPIWRLGVKIPPTRAPRQAKSRSRSERTAPRRWAAQAAPMRTVECTAYVKSQAAPTAPSVSAQRKRSAVVMGLLQGSFGTGNEVAHSVQVPWADGPGIQEVAHEGGHVAAEESVCQAIPHGSA